MVEMNKNMKYIKKLTRRGNWFDVILLYYNCYTVTVTYLYLNVFNTVIGENTYLAREFLKTFISWF